MFSGRRHPVLDPAVLEVIVEATPEWIGFVLVPLTYLGSVFVVTPVVVLAYWWKPERGATWLGAFFAYYGLMASIKSLNSATRPRVEPAVGPEPFPAWAAGMYEHATAISSTSFPSGNAMVTALVVGLLIVDLQVSTLRRRALAGGFVIGLVGYSRLALGVHYPIDVVAGIGLGLLLLAVVVGLRSRVDDGVVAVFVLAAVLAFASVWLRSGGVGVPTWEGIAGSNRNLAFGGAVGALVVWLASRSTWIGFGNRLPRFGPFAVLIGTVAGTYAITAAVSHPLASMLWAAVVFGAVIAAPSVVPNRHDDRGTVGDRRPEPSGIETEESRK